MTLREERAAKHDEITRLQARAEEMFTKWRASEARLAALTAALETAKTLWFNALFDQGTPRDLHIGWYNEWLTALAATLEG